LHENWVERTFQRSIDEGLCQSYLRDPAIFANELRALPRGAMVVVDEIQRLPALLNEVHRFIEDRGLRFVLLGSSGRKLKQAGTNLLTGSAEVRQMFPLLPQELGRATLEQAAFPGSRQSSCST
jgi:predicted AAA+ superfamily ATPase